MSIELPPLRPFDTFECDGYTEKDYNDDGLYVTVEEVEARERILLARVERLELTVQELGLRNAELEAAADRLLFAAINVDLMYSFRQKYPRKHMRLREAIEGLKPLLPEDRSNEM